MFYIREEPTCCVNKVGLSGGSELSKVVVEISEFKFQSVFTVDLV